VAFLSKNKRLKNSIHEKILQVSYEGKDSSRFLKNYRNYYRKLLSNNIASLDIFFFRYSLRYFLPQDKKYLMEQKKEYNI